MTRMTLTREGHGCLKGDTAHKKPPLVIQGRGVKLGRLELVHGRFQFIIFQGFFYYVPDKFRLWHIEFGCFQFDGMGNFFINPG